MPKIESFQFGSIVIDGKTYGRDVIMLPDGLVRERKGGFWKFGSHIINKEEIRELVAANPEVVVLGVGTNARANLVSDSLFALKRANVERIILPSPDAVERLNQLVAEGKRVAALIHITC